MKCDFFKDTGPVFIAVNERGFRIGDKYTEQIQAFIREIMPVRKFFNGKTMECFSNDAKKGRNGELCALCPNRTRCRQRIRLMLVIANKEELEPAQLEINSTSFRNLKETLEPIREEELPNTLITITVVKSDGHIRVAFKTLF
jgi:hypothetical protein